MDEKINVVRAFHSSNDKKIMYKLEETRNYMQDNKTVKLSDIYRDFSSKDTGGTLQYLQKNNSLLKNEKNNQYFKTISR